MEISTYTKQEGQFLKAEIVSKNPTAVFMIDDEGKIVTSEKFGTERLHLQVHVGNEKYTFDCSKTNARTIEQKLGADTKKWIGQGLVFEIYKTKTSEGKMVEALNVKEVKTFA